MAQTLTTLDHQMMFNALDAVRRGDFSVRLPLNWKGLDGKIADAFNDIVSMEEKLAKEIERVTFGVPRRASSASA
jgi:hypothetical protein